MTGEPHGHCPEGCEHPQPFRAEVNLVLAVSIELPFGEREWCGRCWHRFGELVEMEPCTPATCRD